MKILFVWTGVTSYMADCWRALAGRKNVELKIVISRLGKGSGSEFDSRKVLEGLDWTASRNLGVWIPDAMFIVGWHEPTCRFFATRRDWADIPKVICFDMPWEWRLRRIAARFVLARYLRHFKAAFVPGAVSARYARWLGFKVVHQGLFGIDVKKFEVSEASFDAAGPRRGFLFVGRLAKEKCIDVLAKAYRLYRSRSADPWPLDVYGTGSETIWIENAEGIRMHGFAQPDEVKAAYARAGAFVIASKWDPWPLVIAESCAAGLPVICADHCWNNVEIVKKNGIICPVGDYEAMADAMLKVERGEIDGKSGRALIEPYSCEAWAERVMGCLAGSEGLEGLK